MEEAIDSQREEAYWPSQRLGHRSIGFPAIVCSPCLVLPACQGLALPKSRQELSPKTGGWPKEAAPGGSPCGEPSGLRAVPAASAAG